MKIISKLACTLVTSTVLSTVSFASHNLLDPNVSLTITAPKSSDLGQLFDGLNDEIYKLSVSKLRGVVAQGYQPAHDEPSAIELVNRYYIKGENKEYLAAMQKLSDRGNPLAWGVIGWYQAQDNMASQDEKYKQGLHLMAKACEAGVLSAPNNLGMMLWYANDLKKAGIYFKEGLLNPHDAVNYGCLVKQLGESEDKAVVFFMKGAEGGDSCGASALGDYYAKKGAGYASEALKRHLISYKGASAMDPSALEDHYAKMGADYAGEALKWYLISYKGASAMDPFNGFESIIQFMSNTTFLPGQVAAAEAGAEIWMMAHPQIFMDGFDMVRLGMSMDANAYDPTQTFIKGANVLDNFWNYYATGDKVTFASSLIPYLSEGDANAIYMQSQLERGFVGVPNPARRRELLEQAVQKQHPLAYLDLALDLWMEGALESDPELKKNDLKRAYDLLNEGYYHWFDTPHRDAIGEIAFFLGYFNDNGIGMDEKDPAAAKGFFRDAFKLTPLAAGYLGRSMKNPEEAGAYLLIARSSYTNGDWFGGIHHWQDKFASLTKDQRIKAQKIATMLLESYPALSRNIYQRLAAGLHPDFAFGK